MPLPTPRNPPDKPAYLDRPQRLGFLLTRAFWNRPDVKRPTRIVLGGFVILWFTLIDLSASGFWVNFTLKMAGLYLFQSLLERYIRKRLRQRRQLATQTQGALPRHDREAP